VLAPRTLDAQRPQILDAQMSHRELRLLRDHLRRCGRSSRRTLIGVAPMQETPEPQPTQMQHAISYGDSIAD
jgi:hypothetical protein